MLSSVGRIATVIAMLAISSVLGGMVAASAGGATFPAMNTSEQPPDGIYFRYGPDPTQTSRTTGLGVYVGEHVNAKCYWHGTAFGPYSNNVWYYAYDVERPTINGQSNEGWINTHYVDDGQTANNPNPAVRQCAQGSGNGGAPDTTGGVATASPLTLYYSPYNLKDPKQFLLGDNSVPSIFANEYASCSNYTPAHDRAVALASGRPITAIGGWSSGRHGPIYYLRKATDDQLQVLNYVILIDPGSAENLDCTGDIGAGGTFAKWLTINRSAHLVILSGRITQSNHSSAIRRNYLDGIVNASTTAGADLRSRTLVCNYDTGSGQAGHEKMFYAGKYWVGHRIGSACPRLRDGGQAYPVKGQYNP